MVGFIDAHYAAYRVEPICAVLPIAPATYYEHLAQRDAALPPEIERVWQANRPAYGVRKIWRQLQPERHLVARCTVSRMPGALGLRGVLRGRRIITTTPEIVAVPPIDLVQQDSTATRSNLIRVADLTYVATSRGFAYVAFVIDASSRRIVDGRASALLPSDQALDALEQAPYDRDTNAGLVHRHDRGVRYLPIR